MAMPPCGTFHYAGVVPEQAADRESGQWTLVDQSGADSDPHIESPAWWQFWKRTSTPTGNTDPLCDNRLVGLRPVARISGSQFVLEAESRTRAAVASVSLELDCSLLDGLQAGDRIEL